MSFGFQPRTPVLWRGGVPFICGKGCSGHAFGWLCAAKFVHNVYLCTGCNKVKKLCKQLRLRLIVAPRAKFYSKSLDTSVSVPGTTVEWSKIKPFSEIPGPTPLPILRNILDFRKDFPDARVVNLEINYRSTGKIIKAAKSVIASNRRRPEKDIRASRDEGKPLVVYETYDSEEEA